MRRTGVPGEWIWLRDRFAGLTGLRLTTQRVALATGGAIAVLYLASGLLTVQPGEVGGLRFRAHPIAGLGPGLHYACGRSETHRIVLKERQRIEFVPEQPQSTVPRISGGERTVAGWTRPLR
jgi:hypothetical protein